MSDKNLLFKKPIGVLAREVPDNEYGPDAKIVIVLAQNGFKIHVMEKLFVAKTVEEAEEIIEAQLKHLIESLKKNDK